MSMITRPAAGLDLAANPGGAYRMIWCWHFYAGLFCLPFIVVLCLSGAVYLFKPQIDAYLDRGFDHLALVRAPLPLDDQAEAALKANPGARFAGLEFRRDPLDAARVGLMTADGHQLRVLVRPDTLEIMKTEDERSRLSNFMGDLHGQLLMGRPGAIAVELAGAWAIVMVITGLYLWWPRGRGLAGVLYPRLGGGRRFLRDLHAVTGFWLSMFALFYLITALPWTTVWGQGFRYSREIGQALQVKFDWTTGPADQQAKRLEVFRTAPPAPAEAAADGHAGHPGHAHAAQNSEEPGKLAGFGEIAARIAPLMLADPVFIAPPSPERPNWVVASASQNRPLNETLEFDPKNFQQVKHEGFADLPIVDRIIEFGIAAHEGQLFGWLNQLLSLATAAGYLVLVVTSTLMWWRRRPVGLLGAPPAIISPPRLAPFLIAFVIVLGFVLPALGMSLVAVLLAELAIRRFAPGASLWLGLVPASTDANA
ncbi:MAG TPA: PepSY domain-containing protein [Methylocella sp.]|nr:PepSY domain-containing protein [Methylocella sp.]